MAAASFLGIPVTIRERIYVELLTYSTTTPTAEERAPSSTVCKLLFLNRQTHGEISKFLETQLCVLVRTNDPQFVRQILKDREKLSLISQLRSEDGAVQKQAANTLVSMEVDMYMYHNHLDVMSFPAFLIPAKSIKELLRILWSPSWGVWTMQASVSFELTNTFAHTQEAALSKLAQPWIDWFCPQHFVGVSTDPAIPPELSSQLHKKLLGDYAATGHLRKIQSLIRGGFERAQAGIWIGAAERFQMAIRYCKLVWNCHLECVKRESRGVIGGRVEGDFVTHLWLMTIDAAANHVQVLINAALSLETGGKSIVVATNSGDKARLQKAREAAEATIGFLRTRPRRNSEETAEKEDVRIRKAKEKMSFRAHLACKGLGDVNAAIGYLEEAKRYEPESATMLDEKASTLRAEVSSTFEATRPVKLWDGRQMWCF